MIGRTVLGNFTLTFFVAALLFSAIAIARAPKPIGRASAVEKLLSWFVFWTIGVLYLYNAVFHIFFGELAAHYIGWEDSPFQLEVGTGAMRMSAANSPSTRAIRPKASAASGRKTKMKAIAASAASRRALAVERASARQD